MSLEVDGVWKAGVWATTVWADGVWREGAVTTPPAGGWKFISRYEEELERRRKQEERQRALEAETDSIQDELDRDIALLLRRQEAEDARRLELERLGQLAKEHADLANTKRYSERVANAYQRAVEKQTFSALEALDRELKRAREEEQFMLLAMMMVI